MKREWLTGNVYQTRESAIADTHAYIGYYNIQRIHTTIGDMTPIEFEKGLNKVSGFIRPQHTTMIHKTSHIA